MRSNQLLGGFGLVLLLGATPLRAAEPEANPIAQSGFWCPPRCRPLPPSPYPSPDRPEMPPPTEPGAAPPITDAFAQAPRGGTGEAASFNPNLLGDLPASQMCAPLTRTLNGRTEILRPGTNIGFVQRGTIFNFDTFNINGQLVPAGTPFPNSRRSLPSDIVPFRPLCGAGTLALIVRGAFKITENESPRPQDRVFCTYNFFENLNGRLNPPGITQTDLHRETIGFEKTFLDGDASIGMRLPFIQLRGDESIRESDVGDLSIILKYALINDPNTHNVLSMGLEVTVPTGPSFLPAGTPDIHSTLLQPYVGWIYNFGDWFVHGFNSIAVPTDSQDVTYLFNDAAIGYFLPRSRDSNGWITELVPSCEVHVSTPLNHRGSLTQPFGGIDIVDLTFGVTAGLCNRSTLALAFVTPVTGPRPFDWELQIHFNYRF